MLRTLFFTVLIIAFANLSFAQVRATTESGNKVLLFDNGTWKYEEKSVNTAEESASTTEVAPVASVAAIATVEIDSSKSFATDSQNLFYQPSPRLVRYFGESGGNVRGKLSCSNSLGSVKIHFMFEFRVSDGDRYFGWLKEGSIVTFTMDDGQKLEVVLGDESDVKRFEKTNYSMIANASIPLTNSQLATLSGQPFSEIEVGWKKKPEAYDVDMPGLLMDLLPTVF